MALIKQKELDNGAVGEYWVAQTHNNMQSKRTEVLMLLYKNKQARADGKMFLVRERINDIDGVYLSGEQVYAAIKESRMGPVSPAIEAVPEIPAVLDEEGNIVTEAVPAVPAVEAVYQETNWFSNSEDA